MSRQLLLTEFVRWCLTEKAILAPQAQQSGLALCVIDSGEIEVVLYDPVELADKLSLLPKQVVDHDLEEFLQKIDNAFYLSIRGTLLLRKPRGPCNGAMEVGQSAAIKGFGPLLYDIGMSVSRSGLVSDRKNVSGPAKGIWQKYAAKGSGVHGKVTANKLDDKDDPKTPDPNDDCTINSDDAALNNSYSTDSPIATGPFMAAHREFMKRAMTVLKGQGFTEKSLTSRLSSAAQLFFDTRYMEGY